MLQVKATEKRGAEVKTAQGTVWLSPERDILHALPLYLAKTGRLMANPKNPIVAAYYEAGGTDEEIARCNEGLKHYLQTGSDLGVDLDINEVARRAGVSDWPPRFMGLFGGCFSMVVLSHWFHGVREAAYGPLTDDPYQEIPQFFPVRRGWRAKCKQMIYRLGSWF